jgi:hypothetical protein
VAYENNEYTSNFNCPSYIANQESTTATIIAQRAYTSATRTMVYGFGGFAFGPTIELPLERWRDEQLERWHANLPARMPGF